MKPTKLPPGWIVVTSQSHPDRIFYFNVRTNQSSWEMPAGEPSDAGTSDQGTRGRKRKTNGPDDDYGDHRPTTPTLDVPKRAEGDERVVLKAKRIVPVADEKDTAKSKDTPLMAQLREKMLERQAKGNAVKKKKTVQVSPPLQPPPKVETKMGKPTPVSSRGDTSLLEKEKLTPQMKLMLEKKKRRESNGATPKSPARSRVANDESKTAPLRRPRTKSLAPAEMPTPNTAMRTRRSSRPIVPDAVASTSRNCNNIQGYDSGSDSLTIPYSEPKVVISRLTPSFLRAASNNTPSLTPTKAENTSVNERLSGSAGKVKSPRLGRSAILKKNLAAERLAKLQSSFGEETVVDGTSPKRLFDDDSDNRDDDIAASVDGSKSLPSIYKNAEARAKLINDLKRKGSLYEKRMAKTFDADSSTQNCDLDDRPSSTCESSDLFSEEMEWEPIEDERLMQEIQVVRLHIGAANEAPIREEIPQNSLDLTDGPSRIDLPVLYIVVDTNVFLSNLPAIEEARDAVFKTFGKPLIVVPWTVLRELDFIKDDKSLARPELLRMKARKAVRFLYSHFSAKHPRILGQSPIDVAKNKDMFEIECPDDEILQTCLQIKISRNSPRHCVVLLSYDKNLCNKAMVHDIATIGRDDPFEKVDYLHASEARNDSSLTQHLLGIEPNPDTLPMHVKETRRAEEILEEAKQVLTDFLTLVVTTEMQSLYNENWEKYTIMRPPWTVTQVLKCAIKHWIAAVSESFSKRVDHLLTNLLEAMQKVPDSGRKLCDVSHILQIILELLQYAKVEKYSNKIVQSARSIDILKTKCMTAAERLREEKFHHMIGPREDLANEDIRAEAAFRQFEEVYAFARDMCGFLSGAIDMPFSVPYQKIVPPPTIEEVKQIQPDVAANLNRLLHVLSTALEELNSLHADHRAVIALYNALVTFKPNTKGSIPAEFTPHDVYCCLKHRTKMLRSGLDQLEQLSTQFCRMATFRCR